MTSTFIPKVREQLGLHDLVEVIAAQREQILKAVTRGSSEAKRYRSEGQEEALKTTLLLPPRTEFLKDLYE